MADRLHHLLDEPGDRRTLCGLDVQTKESMPHLLGRFVGRHRRGHARAGKAFVVCPDCERAATESGAT